MVGHRRRTNGRPLRPRHRVLHVDDDADIRFLVELTLGAMDDVELRSYATGADALAAALIEPPELALIDVMMPEMDGLTLARELRQHPDLREVPLVFVTAKAHPEELADLRRTGAAEVLLKPFALEQLEQLVRELLDPVGAARRCQRS